MTARRRSHAVGAALLLACVAAVPALAGPGHRTSAGNRHAAVRDATQLLTRVVLPDGARSEPTGDRWGLGREQAARPPGTKMVDRRAWWKVDQPFQQVLDYVQRHPPHGGRLETTESGGPGPPWEDVTFSFPVKTDVLGIRWLAVTMIQLRDGSTGVRVDGQVQWIIPRSPNEKAPSGVKVIDLVRKVHGQAPTVSRRVTEQGQVDRIIKMIDRLPALQSGAWACPAETSDPAIVTLTFRARSGAAPLAQASAPADSGNSETGCDAMSFSIGGRRQTALVHTRHFLAAVGRLLGVKLTERFGR